MGERLLHSPAGVKDGGLEFREPAAERRIGRVVRDDEGRPVGALTGRVARDDEGRPVGALIGRVVRDDEGRPVGALIGRVVRDDEGRPVGALIGRVVLDDEGRPVGALTGRVVRDDEGRPVGALLGLVLQRLGAGCVARSSASFLDVLQVMAPKQEPPLRLVTAGVEHFRVGAEPS